MAVKVTKLEDPKLDVSGYDFEDEVKFELRGDKYARYGDVETFHVIYEGPIWEVVQKIATNHSYLQFDDMTLEEIKSQHVTIAEMVAVIEETNGDGCDYINLWLDRTSS